RIRDFVCPEGKEQAFLWDSEIKQLGVRATASAEKGSFDKKAYIFQNPFNGTDIRITIGACNICTVDDARKQARGKQSLIDEGIDPRQHKAQKRAHAAVVREEARRRLA